MKTIEDFKSGLHIHGRTYRERKESVRDLALEFSCLDCAMSWMDIADVWQFFDKAAKRYGLREEFVNEGII